MVRFGIVTIVMAGLLAGCGQKLTAEREKKRVVQITERAGALSPTAVAGSIDRLKALTDFVYRVTPLMPSAADWMQLSPSQNLENLLDPTKSYGHICAGIAYTLYDLLYAFDFEARYVRLFASDGINNHAVNEVLVEGRWIGLDPTFNAVFPDENGTLLSFSEMQARVREGKTLRWTYLGRVQPLRRIEEYYIPYEQLLDVVEPSKEEWYLGRFLEAP